MEMERFRVRIVDLRVVMVVVADGDPDLLVAFTAMLDVLASECEERLRTLHECWSPRAPPASPRRSAESFTDDELRGSFRFGRDAIAELLGLLGFPTVLRSASGRRFGGEEAFLLLLRRLGGRERGLELA
eukprot:scaffold1301_cov363-Pavlova_lutheri.AAC.10